VSPLGVDDFSREPVLVRSYGGKSGLILTRQFGSDQFFAYVPLKRFSQALDGTVTAEIAGDPVDDPIGYLGAVGSVRELAQWRGDRAWLKLALDRSAAEPTVVFSMAAR